MKTSTISHHRLTYPVLGSLLLATWISTVTFPAALIAGQDEATEASQTYLAYNIWYQKPTKISSVNYRRGTMLPAGTELSSVQLSELGSRRLYVKITTAKDNATFTIYFYKKFHPGITLDEFKDRLITTKTFEEMTSGLKKEEIGAIKEGRLIAGLSKDAVVMCRGYPPEHRTPSLSANKWPYWENRFRKKAIHFDKDGRTTRSPSDKDDI